MLARGALALHYVELDQPVELRMARACLTTVVAFLLFARQASAIDTSWELTWRSHHNPSCIYLNNANGQQHACRLAPLDVPIVSSLTEMGGLILVDLAALLVRQLIGTTVLAVKL